MSIDEHLARYVNRAKPLPVFGFSEHDLYGDPFFRTLRLYRLHHHLEHQLSFGLDVSLTSTPVILPKGGFSCAPIRHEPLVIVDPGARVLPAPGTDRA